MENQSWGSEAKSQETIMSDTGFSHTVDHDQGTGWSLITLRYRDPKEFRNHLEVRIAPEAGANLHSMRIGETELLVVPKKLSDLRGFQYGVPVLYPTPNLVQNSQFVFDGRAFKFIPNEGLHFLHGLVHSLSWQAAVPWSDSTGAGLVASLDWNQAQPDFPLFPIVHRLSLSFHLHSTGVKFEFTVENRDDKRLPFGFALHPWFRVLGSRAKTWLQVPAQKHMEAIDLFPTGNLTGLESSALDLRHPVSLESLDLDDVYWGMSAHQPAGYTARDEKIKLSLTGSAEFTHMVVYTPKGSPFFCMENQTCSTDAHNLFSRGFEKEAHLLIAEKGELLTGWVRVEVRRLD
jgi:aldose 1-epimerase